MQDDIEGIVHRGSVALDPQVGADGLRFAKEHQGLVDQVRSEIEEHAAAGFGSFAPGVVFGLRTEAVEVGFEKDHATQFSICDQALEGDEVPVPAAILIDGKKPSLFSRDPNQRLSLAEGGGERLVNDDVATSEQALLGEVEVRGVWRGNDNQPDRFNSE